MRSAEGTEPMGRWGVPPILLAWLVAGVGAITLSACGGERAGDTRPYLAAALETADWLDGVASERDGLRWWPDWVEQSDRVNPSLGSGVGGPIMFYLALANATGDDRYRETAVAGGRYLLDTLPAVLADAAEARSPGSLYGGLPSVALTLNAVFRATGDSAFHRAAIGTVERLHQLVRVVDDGVEWAPYNDVLFGSAGTGLFLVHAGREWGHRPSLDMARRIGETLLARAEPAGVGLTWRLRQDRDIYLPNFSHGPAGVGFFLATLSQALDEPRYLEAAIAAGEYLTSIARTDDGGFILPYSVPNGEFNASWDVGWAHGPAGSARLFYALWRITGHDRWGDVVTRSVVALRNSGLPGKPTAEFETERFRIDQRFGQAGVAMFLLDLYQATGDNEYQTFGREVVDSILAQSTIDSAGRRWTIPQYGFMPAEGEPATFTGYFYGAAGFGLALLRLDAASQGSRWEPALPDNPFGRME